MKSSLVPKKLIIAALAASGLTGGAVVFAQADKVNSAISEQTKTEQAAQDTQKKINSLDDETSGMVQDYRTMLTETIGLKAYNDQLEIQVKSQEEEIATKSKQLSQIEQTAHDVLPMMVKMLDTLDQFVKLDVPFLMEERTDRIAKLREMMAQPDVTLSEKYRKIVEAYQIEADYGRSIDASEGKVGEKTVQFLRVGRLALMYQTLDGSETGYWDQDAKQWVQDNKYREYVIKGLKIAKKEAGQDLLTVAVGAPKGAE